MRKNVTNLDRGTNSPNDYFNNSYSLINVKLIQYQFWCTRCIHPESRNITFTTSNDSRMNELFTEGSHHRNVSIIAVNQNLYHSKESTQRRNSHYLLLYNNPVDRQQIMNMARQVYPENPKHMWRHFEETTSKLNGFLLVVAKSATPEHLRLCIDVLNHRKHKTEQICHIIDKICLSIGNAKSQFVQKLTNSQFYPRRSRIFKKRQIRSERNVFLWRLWSGIWKCALPLTPHGKMVPIKRKGVMQRWRRITHQQIRYQPKGNGKWRWPRTRSHLCWHG